MIHSFSFQLLTFFIASFFVIYLLNTKPYKNNLNNKILLKKLLEGFDLDLPDELKELVRGMQVADAQLRMHEDTLKVLAVGRQSMAAQLNQKLKGIAPVSD